MNGKMRSMAVGLALLAAAAPAGSFAQQAGPGSGQMRSGTGEMPEACRQMMEQRAAMKKEMAEMDARLQALTEKMNAAAGEAKVEAIAAVVNQLVDQQRTMHERMQTMGPMMMQHMSGHMESGSMACPDDGDADTARDAGSGRSGEGRRPRGTSSQMKRPIFSAGEIVEMAGTPARRFAHFAESGAEEAHDDRSNRRTIGGGEASARLCLPGR